MSRRFNQIVPAWRRVWPMMLLISVVLPVPLRPSTASADCRWTDNEMSDNTTASPYPADRCSTRRTSDMGDILAQIDRPDPGVARDIGRGALDEQRPIDQHRNAFGEAEHQIH